MRFLLPVNAKNTILRILKNKNINDERIYIINNLEKLLLQKLEYERSPTGDKIGWIPFVYEKIIGDFEYEIRKILQDIGNLIDIETYKSGISSCHESSFLEIYDFCVASGLNCEIGSCDGFFVDNNGNASHNKVGLLRITEGNSLCELSKVNQNQLHITRFFYTDKDTSPFKKIKWFKNILDILFKKVSVVSGSSATCNDKSIEMSDGKWRFESKSSVFGFDASKLFLFWLRCGGFPMHLLEGNPNLIYFYREDAALAALEDYKQSRPGRVSPFFYASDRGIYSKETLLQLK
jgi:hypothetical protein